METLKIKNFLCIEEAEIEIKKINLFIGAQAQGKSVIAKLIYFFKEYPQSIFDAIYRGEKDKAKFDKNILAEFEKIFPRYTWNKTQFSIIYTNKYYSISLINKIVNNDLDFKVNNTVLVDNVFGSLVTFKKSAESYSSKYNHSDINLIPELYYHLIDNLFENAKYSYLEEVIYIPAGRSFFANIQKNIFSILNEDIQIEYFLKKFGRSYGFIKNNYITRWDESKKGNAEKITRALIGGEFISENGNEWIINNKDKINLADSSSGQQEVLPITIVLSKISHNVDFITSHFIIEEPEAHLFPIAQSQVVSLIALIYNELTARRDLSVDEEGEFLTKFIRKRQNTFTITTHSPYILTAFNNLIQAGNVAASKNYQNLEELYKVVSKDEIVDFNDVSAYLVNNGTVQSIMNQELKLIDANMIDEVSNQFADTFEKLISMEEIND